MKGIGKGWHYKYPEHALAAKGIRTKIKLPKVKKVGYTKFFSYSQKEAAKYNAGQQKYSLKKAFEKQKFEEARKVAEAEVDSEGSDYSLSVIVPSTYNINEKISRKEYNSRVRETKKEMDGLFFGSTSINEVGSYVKDGKVINEDGVMVSSNTDKEGFEKNKKQVVDFAFDKGVKWKQDSMAVAVETPQQPSKALHFIETNVWKKTK
jgi:hypothetical protein